MHIFSEAHELYYVEVYFLIKSPQADLNSFCIEHLSYASDLDGNTNF